MDIYAVHYHPRRADPDNRAYQRVAMRLKSAQPDAIAIAAPAIAALLPDSPIWLIPIPNCRGDTSANLALCRAIRKILPKARICDGLTRSEPVESSCARRRLGMRGLPVKYHKMKRTAAPLLRLPVWFVDNVITTGTTFKAAHHAFGTGQGIAYADASSPAIQYG